MVTALLLGIAAAPLIFIPVPAMIDYVNHLARMQLLAAPGPFQGYVVTWTLAPNLAMDLIVPLLGRVMPVDIAARLFVAITWLLVVSGAVALERAVRGRHVAAGLCAVPVLFSVPFAWGLINFCFGLGVALWGLALWVSARDRPLVQRWALHCGIVAALFLAHFFALGLYGLVVGLVEFPRFLGPRPKSLAPSLGTASNGASDNAPGPAVLAVLLASPVAVLLALLHLGGGGIGGRGIDWDLALKLHWPLAFFSGDNASLARLSGAAVIILIAWMAARRDLRLSREGAWVGAGLLLLYLALPRRLFDIAYLDVRVLALAVLVMPAFVSFRPSRRAAAVLVALALVNGTAMVANWAARQPDYAEFCASFSALSPGTAVLVAVAPDSRASDMPLYYAPTLAVPTADVFVPSFYAFGGSQPVAPAPAFAGLAVAQGLDALPVPLGDLLGGTPPPHARDWQHRYDYLYVIGPPRQSPLPGVLVEIAHGARFRLYRITPRMTGAGAAAGLGQTRPDGATNYPSP
jgi:hypothetical protein